MQNIAESPSFFKGGLVTCSNESRIACGIDARVITEHGANSPEVAQAMAGAARVFLDADVGVSITGADETKTSSAGTVYIGIDDGRSQRAIKGNYPGSRAQVKRRAATAALFELRKALAE